MDQQPTCGKGLAEHSAFPAKLSELIAAMAENLEAHLASLDQRDENSRREHEAYVQLARRYRDIARQLRATAKQMADYRDLPMGRHDPAALSDPAPRAAFERFVRLEQELQASLQQWVERDRGMLDSMLAGARGSAT